jgi:transcriptional regulator with XRE-family HTH domain
VARRLPQDPDRCFRRRIAAGLSQQQLADKAGISDATVCRIENGTVKASVDSLAALADALDCAVTDLMPAEQA